MALYTLGDVTELPLPSSKSVPEVTITMIAEAFLFATPTMRLIERGCAAAAAAHTLGRNGALSNVQQIRAFVGYPLTQHP